MSKCKCWRDFYRSPRFKGPSASQAGSGARKTEYCIKHQLAGASESVIDPRGSATYIMDDPALRSFSNPLTFIFRGALAAPMHVEEVRGIYLLKYLGYRRRILHKLEVDAIIVQNGDGCYKVDKMILEEAALRGTEETQ